MSDFVFAYHGGKTPESPEEGAKPMAKWNAWVDGLGDAVVNPGTHPTPFAARKTVTPPGSWLAGTAAPSLQALPHDC